MSNDSKRVSELTQASTLHANDRVVVLTNPNTAANAQTITLANFGLAIANNGMPIANSTQLGVIKIGDGLAIAANGTVTAPLPIASKTVTGVVKIGDNINVNANGLISVNNLVPPDGGSIGYVFTSDANGNGHWQAFPGVYNIITLNTYGANVYPVSANDSIILVDPNAIGSDVRVILPIASAIEGKEILIKNIEPGYQGFKVIVTSDRPSFSYIESPVTGNFGINYEIIDRGQAETWIHDGELYRHLATARAIPIFYTDANTYAQVAAKNASHGTNSSTDIVAYNDEGDEINGTGPFIDMGIDGSNYSNSSFSLFGPNDGYLYTGNANLLIGVDSDKTIKFFANGTTSDKKVLSINSTGITANLNIIPQTNSISLGDATHMWNHTYTNTINIPVGSIVQSTVAVSTIVNDVTLLTVDSFSTGSSLPIGTVGNSSEITAPWTVYQLTATPSPALQVGDVIGGPGVPVGSSIAYVGSSSYSAYIVANTTNSTAENGATITVARAVVNPSFQISTGTSTDIALIPGANGHIVVNSDIIPINTNQVRLGSPAKRFKELWLGPGTLYVADETLGVDQAIGARDGNFYVKGGAGLSVGEFNLRDNTIAIANSSRDILFGSTLATGNVIFNRPIAVKTYDTGKTSFSISRAGLVNVITPATILTTQAALSITGANSEVSQPRNFTGTLIQGTAQDGQPARVGFDAFGANTYVAIAGRGARGTVQSPSGTQANDTIMRFSMQGWTTDGNAYAGSIGRINMQAAENFYTANTGTKITFQLTPVGSNSIQAETVAFTANGMNFTNNPYGAIKFNDGSTQNSAFNSTSAVTSISVGTGLSVSGPTGAVGIDTSAALSIAGATNQISIANVGGNYTLSLPQDINTTSIVQFQTLTVHDLNVTGTTTSAACTNISDKVFNLAYDSTSAAQIDGGGFTLGNSASAYVVSVLYNLSNNSWNTGGSNIITKNLSANSINGNTGIFQDALHVGAAYQGYDYPNSDLQLDCNINSYNQVVQQNHSAGTQASADFVATNDLGDDSSHYIDFGINSSTYANSLYNMGGPNDGYLYVNSGNLDIATQTAGKIIQFYTGNTTADALRATINTSGLSVVGNISATYINGTLTGTANSANYIGTLPAANVVSNAQLSANLANYQTTAGLAANVATLGYQTAAGLAANVATLTANLATYVIANTGIVSNSSGVFVNSAYITSITGVDLSGYQTIAGLAANVATLIANNTSFVGTVSAANVVSNSQLSANLANYALNNTLTFYQTTSGLSANVGTLTSNNTLYVGTVTALNVVSNAQLSANLANYQTTAGMVNYQTTAGMSSNVVTLTSNNTNYVGSVTAANVVSNAQLQANLSNYVTTTVGGTYVNSVNFTANLANYQTTAGLASNVATLTANNTYFVGTVHYANVVSNAQLQANLSGYLTTASLNGYQTEAGLSANVAKLTSNSANYIGTLIAANVVSNSQLTANLANYQTTAGLAANVATLTANNTGYLGGVAAVNYTTVSGNYTITGTRTFDGNTTFSNNIIISTGANVYANGVLGSVGQVLASNGSSVYWTNNVPEMLVFSLEADRSLATSNASQSMFGKGVTLKSDTKYRYKIIGTVYKSNTSLSSTGALQFAVTNSSATAVISRNYFMANPCAANNAQSTLMAAFQMSQNISANFQTPITITNSNTGATWYNLIIDGVLDITTGGTINPQIAFTHTGGLGASTILQNGATIEIWPVGNATSNAVIGQWA